jgi:hypothetical protein
MKSRARNRHKIRPDPGMFSDRAKAEKYGLISTGEREVSGEMYSSIGPASLCGTRLQLQFRMVATEQNKVSDICSTNQIRTRCSREFCLFLKTQRVRPSVRQIYKLRTNCKTNLVETTEERLMCWTCRALNLVQFSPLGLLGFWFVFIEFRKSNTAFHIDTEDGGRIFLRNPDINIKTNVSETRWSRSGN